MTNNTLLGVYGTSYPADVYDSNSNKIDEQKYASLEGTNIDKGDVYYSY